MSASERVGEYIRSNLLGIVAIYLALAGITWAAVEQPKAPPNSVNSRAIKNAQVKNKDLAAAAVSTEKLADESVTGAKVVEGSLGQVPSAQEAAHAEVAESAKRADTAASADQAASAEVAANAQALQGLSAAELQKRVTTDCAPNGAIGSLNADGTANCVAGSAGDITAVSAGNGLTGGGTSGAVSLAVNPTVFQSRVTGTCAPGSSISAIAQAGTVSCEVDNDTALPQGAVPPGGDLAGNYPSPTIGANAVGSAEVVDNNLTGSDIDEASLDIGIGRWGIQGNADCLDENGTGEICASQSLTLPRQGRVLIIANTKVTTYAFDDLIGSNAGGDAPLGVTGQCVILVDGAVFAGTGRGVGEGQAVAGSSAPVHYGQKFWTGFGQDLSITAVSNSLNAGAHTFALQCTETNGDVDFFLSDLVVVTLDND